MAVDSHTVLLKVRDLGEPTLCLVLACYPLASEFPFCTTRSLLTLVLKKPLMILDGGSQFPHGGCQIGHVLGQGGDCRS